MPIFLSSNVMQPSHLMFIFDSVGTLCLWSALSLHNKLVLYSQMLKPIWTYGIQLWGCAAQNTIAVIQRFQNKVLRDIVNAPWYVRNVDLHRDLNVEMVTAAIRRFARKHEERLHQHVNAEAIQLLDNNALVRRFKRIKPFELVCWFQILGNWYHHEDSLNTFTQTQQAEPLGDACRWSIYHLG